VFNQCNQFHTGRPATRATRSGFTLVELLVVIAIIGVLMSLILPAVNAARESARRMTCQNHLRSLGQAAQSFSSQWKDRLPSGGWGPEWVGMPGRLMEKQPGGWIYQLLPYLDEKSLAEADPTDLKLGNAKRASAALPFLFCPSRRQAARLPYPTPGNMALIETNSIPEAGRNDYAACAGADLTGQSRIQCDVTSGQYPASFSAINDFPAASWPDVNKYNGATIPRQSILLGQIEDGAGKTYLYAEKSLEIPSYDTGFGTGDKYPALTGFGVSNIRSCDNPPLSDSLKVISNNNELAFGCAHPAGVNAVYCDSTTTTIDFAIAPQVYKWLGSRNDKQPIPDGN